MNRTNQRMDRALAARWIALTASAVLLASGLAVLGMNPPGDSHAPAHPPAHPPTATPASKPATNPPATPANPAAKKPATAKPGTSVEKNKESEKKTTENPAGASEHGAAAKNEPPSAPTGAGGGGEPESAEAPTGEQALAMLKEGNERWAAGNPTHPSTGILRRKATAENGQKPFVTVLTCADSRLPVERLFDRGVGDVFVLRVAGNVVGTNEAGTIEYGTEHLHTPLLVVMGHSKCGAVTAVAKGAHVEGNIGALVAPIIPAVARAKKNGAESEEAVVAAAIRENVWQSVFDLYRTSPMVCKLVKEHKVMVVGAVCDVSTGKIEWLGEHPWQDALVEALMDRKPGQPHAAPATTNVNAEPK